VDEVAEFLIAAAGDPRFEAAATGRIFVRDRRTGEVFFASPQAVSRGFEACRREILRALGEGPQTTGRGGEEV